jgi:hypothetical protein
LDTPIVAASQQRSLAIEHSRSYGDAAFRKTLARFLDRNS